MRASFGAAHLYIDDCVPMHVTCESQTQLVVPAGDDGKGHVNTCWDPTSTGCVPCRRYDDQFFASPIDSVAAYWTDLCNRLIPDCNGHCVGDWDPNP